MPIYLKRRLWRHMLESHMSSYPRAIRLWQSVCSFVIHLVMFRQSTIIVTSSSPQNTKKARISPGNACRAGFVRSCVGKLISHLSLSYDKICTFNCIIAIAVYPATNKIMYKQLRPGRLSAELT